MDLGKLKDIASKVSEVANAASKSQEPVKKTTTAVKPTAKPKSDSPMVIKENGTKCPLDQVSLGEIYTKEDGSKARKLMKMPDTVDSMAGMQSLLRQLAPATTPAMTLLLQNQLQVLESVNNASMTMMAMDNMVFSLSKAVQSTNNEEEKIILRDNFSMMIQSFLFFTEAKLMFAVESNRQEALNLLSDAGDILTKCIAEAATAAATAAANSGKKIADKVVAPMVKNIFSSPSEGPSFLGKFLSFLGNKKIIEEKKQEFYKMISNMFPLFDQYSELIGPNILINGLLLRYANDLALKYETKKLATLGNRIDAFAPKKSLFQKREEMDVDFVRFVIADVESDAKAAKRAYENDQEELKEYKAELDSLGLFALRRKEELKEKIAKQEKEVKQKRDLWEVQDMRKQKLDQLLAPINADVDALRRQYTTIANKYATNGLDF